MCVKVESSGGLTDVGWDLRIRQQGPSTSLIPAS